MPHNTDPHRPASITPSKLPLAGGIPSRFPLARPDAPDKVVVGGTAEHDTFLKNAASLLETAEAALAAGEPISDMGVLIGWDGGIRMVADCDWPLPALEAHHGVRMAFRVSQRDRKVTVEGKAGVRTCLFGAAKPDGAAPLRLAIPPLYTVVGAPISAPHRASIAPLLPAASD